MLKTTVSPTDMWPMRRPLVLLCLALAGCAGPACGVKYQSDDPPTIVSANIVDSRVVVAYRIPGADGGDWPFILLSVLEPEIGLLPRNHEVRSVQEQGTTTTEFEVGADREVIVYGSVFYEDGRRVYLPEFHLHSPDQGMADPSRDQGFAPPGSARAEENCRRAERGRPTPEVYCGRDP